MKFLASALLAVAAMASPYAAQSAAPVVQEKMVEAAPTTKQVYYDYYSYDVEYYMDSFDYYMDWDYNYYADYYMDYDYMGMFRDEFGYYAQQAREARDEMLAYDWRSDLLDYYYDAVAEMEYYEYYMDLYYGEYTFDDLVDMFYYDYYMYYMDMADYYGEMSFMDMVNDYYNDMMYYFEYYEADCDFDFFYYADAFYYEMMYYDEYYSAMLEDLDFLYYLDMLDMYYQEMVDYYVYYDDMMYYEMMSW